MPKVIFTFGVASLLFKNMFVDKRFLRCSSKLIFVILSIEECVMKKVKGILIFFVALFGFTAYHIDYSTLNVEDILEMFQQLTAKDSMPNVSQLQELTDFDGKNHVVEINNNQPQFTTEDLSLQKDHWQTLSNLDFLNRVGSANALISKRSFPTEEREALTVSPSGWKQKKIGKSAYLYDRCHLIGFQLTGENNNWQNLFTGTTELNRKYMVIYENEIADYIKQSNHHVRYRVTPYFKENELVARGVQLEAQSIEDNTVRFNVFIYNVQEGYQIDYSTGRAQKASM